jgi:hypothetical protein
MHFFVPPIILYCSLTESDEIAGVQPGVAGQGTDLNAERGQQPLEAAIG